MTEYLDRYPTMHEYAEGKRINPKLTDLISRADAIEAVRLETAKRGLLGRGDILDILSALPSTEAPKPTGELIARADAVKAVRKELVCDGRHEAHDKTCRFIADVLLSALPSADAVQGEWIPCGEKMPKELERVNVTWLNHNPPFYYQHIKDIPQTDTAVYYRGKWYWWDATVIDVLAEYGEDCNAEQIDKDIEVVAWMPLPTPYKGGDDE